MKLRVSMKYEIRKNEGRNIIDIRLRNTGRAIAFFTRLQLLDPEGKPVRPSFYTDSFFSMLPGETRTVTIETDEKPEGKSRLVLKGYNLQSKDNYIDLK